VRRVLGLSLLVLLAGFLTLTLAATLQYPGGTWCSKSSPGFDPAANYLCDLLHERGLNGAPNPGARLAHAGMVLLSLALIPFWNGVAWLSRARPRVARATLILGMLSAIGTLLVSFNPSDRFRELHQLTVLSTTGASLAAAALAMVGLRSAPRGRGLFVIAACALSLAAIDGALYLQQVLAPRDCTILLPLLQKTAAFFILLWMTGVALRLLRDPSGA
jgi:hypothetical protein